jgi:hypothetical protein
MVWSRVVETPHRITATLPLDSARSRFRDYVLSSDRRGWGIKKPAEVIFTPEAVTVREK